MGAGDVREYAHPTRPLPPVPTNLARGSGDVKQNSLPKQQARNSPLKQQDFAGFEPETADIPVEKSHQQPVEFEAVHGKPPKVIVSTG